MSDQVSPTADKAPTTVDTSPSLSIDEVYRQLKQEQKTAAEAATPPAEAEPEETTTAADTLEAQEAEDPTDGTDEPVEEAEEEAGDGEEGTEDSEDPVYLVKVNGEEIEVPASELIKGYTRQSDYTRKSQALAEERKAFDAQRQEFQTREVGLDEERNKWATMAVQYGQALEHLGTVINGDEAKWGQWRANRAKTLSELQALASEDIQEWTRRKAVDDLEQAQYQHWLDQKQALKAEQERHGREAETARAETIGKAQQALRAHLDKRFPEWAVDTTKRMAGINRMAEAAKAYGFTDQELGSLYDPRAWEAFHDLAEYRALKGKEAKVLQGQPKPRPQPVRTIKAGAPRPSVNRIASAHIAELRAKAEATGQTSDVLALMKAEQAAKAQQRR